MNIDRLNIKNIRWRRKIQIVFFVCFYFALFCGICFALEISNNSMLSPRIAVHNQDLPGFFNIYENAIGDAAIDLRDPLYTPKAERVGVGELKGGKNVLTTESLAGCIGVVLSDADNSVGVLAHKTPFPPGDAKPLRDHIEKFIQNIQSELNIKGGSSQNIKVALILNKTSRDLGYDVFVDELIRQLIGITSRDIYVYTVDNMITWKIDFDVTRTSVDVDGVAFSLDRVENLPGLTMLSQDGFYREVFSTGNAVSGSIQMNIPFASFGDSSV